MNYKLIAQKFLKGALIGAGSSIFATSLPIVALTSISEYKKLLLSLVIAGAAGALHGIWDAGKQMLQDKQA